MSKWSRVLAALAPLSLAVVAVAGDGPGVVATWSGGEVTAEQYASWSAFRGETNAARRAEEVQDMLLVTILSRQARQAGLDATPDARRTLEIMEQRALSQALRMQRAETISVDEAAIEARLAENPHVLERPAQVRIRTLFKRLPPDADAEARTAVRSEIDALRDRVLAGADFSELATSDSDSQARFRAGLLGNVQRGQLPSAIEDVVFALEPGEISEVVQTPDGFSLFYCDQHIAPRLRTEAEAREMVRRNLRNARIKEGWERFLDSLLEQAEIVFPEATPTQPDDVVATYRDGRVLLADIAAWRGPLGGGSPADGSSEATRLAASQIVQTRLAAAQQGDLDDHPELRDRLAWQTDSWLATAELTRRVREVFDAPAESAIRQYFEANRDRFFQPERFELSVIQIETTRQDLTRRYREALELREALARGEIEFATAAARHSQHSSAADGGRLEVLPRPVLAGLGPNLFKTVVAMEPGQVSELVQQNQALWIVELHGREPMRRLEYEEAREAAERRLGTELARQAKARIEAELRETLQVQLVD